MGNCSSLSSLRRGAGAGNVYFKSSRESRWGCFLFSSVRALWDWVEGVTRRREEREELVLYVGNAVVCEVEE